jgi:hypothetical protein
VSEPVWIEVATREAAQDLALTLARHGIRGVPFATGDVWYVRVPGSRERAPQLLYDLAVALESSRGVTPVRRGPGRLADRRAALATSGGPPSHVA